MSQFRPIEAFTPDQLEALANPPAGAKLQAVRGHLWDSQLYTSGTTTKLTFFTTVQTDLTLGNALGNNGAMPAKTYFRPDFINFDIHTRATVSGANTAVGAFDDIQQLVFTQRGTVTMKIGSTAYPNMRISYLHTSGGAIGTVSASLTAPQGLQGANNGQQDGGYNFAGSGVLCPGQTLSVIVNWAAAATLLSGNIYCSYCLDGTWYLPVA